MARFKTGLTKRVAIGALAAALAAAGAADSAGMDAPTIKAAVDRQLDLDYPALDALYKDLHSHPELGFQEVRTAAKLAAEMRAIGFEVTEHVGKTGLVAIYKNGSGPTVLVRTELDALPMQETTGLAYASRAQQLWEGKESFVDHSCGHDIHMAIWLGTAKTLVAMKSRWRGTLMFIAQPAEETLQGAKAMLADGLFERFGKPDYGFALHVVPGPYGTVMSKPGVLTSFSDDLNLRFIGRGGHGAMPDRTIDPVVMAGRFIVDVQSVVSREKDPTAFGVVTIGSINGGSASNIIPQSVLLRGTVRSYSEDVRRQMLAGIARTARATAEMSGAPAPQLDVTHGANPVVNDVALTARTADVFRAAFGAKAISLEKPSTASEDYSDFILAGVASDFFLIGGFDPARVAEAGAKGLALPVNHSPDFAPVAEPTIRTGVDAMSLAVLNLLMVSNRAQTCPTSRFECYTLTP
jgi:hippurate hydrolase